MLYLYPLLLQAVKDVPYHGVCCAARSTASARADARPGRASATASARASTSTSSSTRKLEAKHADRGKEVKAEVKKAGFKKELIVANVRKMRKLVAGLEWNPPQGVWVAYGERNSYTDDDAKRKDEFVREVATSQRWGLTWDIGANNGRYSRIAAEGSDYVLAVDDDQGPIELLYRTLRDEGDEKILTLTMNLADPSPGLGWRGAERKDLADRGKPDLVLALALIHHVTIAANVPVAEFVDWLASLGTSLVIEFPTREDPMVKKLLGPQARGPAPRLRARELRARAGRRLRRRAPRAAGVRHPAAVLRPPQGQRLADRSDGSRGLMSGARPLPRKVPRPPSRPAPGSRPHRCPGPSCTWRC